MKIPPTLIQSMIILDGVLMGVVLLQQSHGENFIHLLLASVVFSLTGVYVYSKFGGIDG